MHAPSTTKILLTRVFRVSGMSEGEVVLEQGGLNTHRGKWAEFFNSLPPRSWPDDTGNIRLEVAPRPVDHSWLA